MVCPVRMVSRIPHSPTVRAFSVVWNIRKCLYGFGQDSMETTDEVVTSSSCKEDHICWCDSVVEV